MKSLILLFGLTIAAVAGEVDELVAKIEKAREPKNNVSIRSYISRTMTFTSTLQVPLQIDYIYKSPNKIKIITRIRGAGDTIQAYNGHTAWEQLADGTVRLLNGPTADYLQFFITLGNPAVKMAECFSKIEIISSNSMVDKEPCYQLECTPLPHFRQKTVIYWVSRNDFLPRRADMEILTTGAPVPMTSWFVDYHDYDGLIMPKETRTASPQSPVISRILEVKVNQEIDNLEFNPPASF